MDVNYGKLVFDNYFNQVITILTIFLLSGKGQFFEFFDDTIIFLSILLPTILRFFLTNHRFWGFFIIILGLILIYFLYEFHYTPPKTNKDSKLFKYFRKPLTFLIKLSSLIPLYMTLYIYYLPLSVEVYDDTSKKLISPFESPKNIDSFCLIKSDVIGCKVSYYIRLYIVWLSVLICLIDFGLVYTFLNTKYIFPLRILSPLRFIWFVIISLIPGVVFGILLSDENYYLYKISTGLSISACVSLVKHYVGKDVHTFFSHYINHHRMFGKSIENLSRAKEIKSILKIEDDPETDEESDDPKIKEMSNGLKTEIRVSKKVEKGTRDWVRKNINYTSTSILKITEKLKNKIISDHLIEKKLQEIESHIESWNLDPVRKEEVLSDLKEVRSQFIKEITGKLENNIGSNLKDEIDSNLSQVIDSKFGTINLKEKDSLNLRKRAVSELNPEEEAGSKQLEFEIVDKLSDIKNKVTEFFKNFEDDMEGCGLYQILTEEDKSDIQRNSENLSNIAIYLDNHKELKLNKSSNETNINKELDEIKCD